MEFRLVNFWNEISSDWCFDCFVQIIKKSELYNTVAVAIGSVKYTDGSWLDIYEQDGLLVGVEWFE